MDLNNLSRADHVEAPLLVCLVPCPAAALSQAAAVNKAASTHVVRRGRNPLGHCRALWRPVSRLVSPQRHLQPRKVEGRNPPGPASPVRRQTFSADPPLPKSNPGQNPPRMHHRTTPPPSTAGPTRASNHSLQQPQPPLAARLLAATYGPNPGGFQPPGKPPWEQPGSLRASITRPASCFCGELLGQEESYTTGEGRRL